LQITRFGMQEDTAEEFPPNIQVTTDTTDTTDHN